MKINKLIKENKVDYDRTKLCNYFHLKARNNSEERLSFKIIYFICFLGKSDNQRV